MLSEAMENVIQRLSFDIGFVEDFFANPELVLSTYDLTEEERLCLMTRDTEGLLGLGLSESDVSIAMSGAHSQGCHAQTQVVAI